MLKPTFMISSSASISPLTSSSHTILKKRTSNLLNRLPMHNICHSQLIYCFIQTQYQHQVLSYLLSMNYIPHIALSMDSQSFAISQSFLHAPVSLLYIIAGPTYLLYIAPFSHRKNLFLYNNSPLQPHIYHLPSQSIVDM